MWNTATVLNWKSEREETMTKCFSKVDREEWVEHDEPWIVPSHTWRGSPSDSRDWLSFLIETPAGQNARLCGERQMESPYRNKMTSRDSSVHRGGQKCSECLQTLVKGSEVWILRDESKQTTYFVCFILASVLDVNRDQPTSIKCKRQGLGLLINLFRELSVF